VLEVKDARSQGSSDLCSRGWGGSLETGHGKMVVLGMKKCAARQSESVGWTFSCMLELMVALGVNEFANMLPVEATWKCYSGAIQIR